MIRLDNTAKTSDVAKTSLVAVGLIILSVAFGGVLFAIAVALLSMLGFIAWYIAGHNWPTIPQGHCPNCRYDLRGNPDCETCPECGHPNIGEQTDTGDSSINQDDWPFEEAED